MKVRVARRFRLRQGGQERIVHPGEPLDIPEDLARKLFAAGLADPDEPPGPGVPTLAELRARGVFSPYAPEGAGLRELRRRGWPWDGRNGKALEPGGAP